MKALPFLLSLALFLLATGCETRSISDSGYRRGANRMYRGELTELDILGVAPRQEATEENIRKALATNQRPKLKRGDRMLLIQSGAMVPDDDALEETLRYFEVAPFSGVPPNQKEGFSESLRLRAAQGGYPYIVCYWGVLETATEDREGKGVSWVPVVGQFVPDQKQQMRIRLKALLLDVRTGAWAMFNPESYSGSKYSSRLTREQNDQRLVENLKRDGYRALVADLLK